MDSGKDSILVSLHEAVLCAATREESWWDNQTISNPVSKVSCVCFCAWCQSVSVRTPALVRFSRFIIPSPPFAVTLEDKLPRAYDQEASV